VLGVALAALGLIVAGVALRQSRSVREPATSTAGAARMEAPARASAPIASAARPAAPAVASGAASCRACEDQNRGGLCVKEMGCQGLSGPDRRLCDDLLRCLDQHPECRAKDPTLCYCGTAKGMACLRAPNGPCLNQALAAAKTSDLMESARRFYVPSFPSGRAAQVAACHLRACRDQCLGVEL
jgi:hypothetical protein